METKEPQGEKMKIIERVKEDGIQFIENYDGSDMKQRMVLGLICLTALGFMILMVVAIL